MKNSVIILAAGEGTRMKSSKSKVLHELCGVEMINHIIAKASAVSDDIFVVLGFQFDAVKTAIEARHAGVHIVRQDTVGFPGTAGAVRACLSNLKREKTLVICGDMPLVEVAELERLGESTADVTVSAFESANPFGYGRVITEGGKVVKIVEQKDASEAERAVNLCNAGAYAFDTALLRQIVPQIGNNNASREYYLTDAIEIAIKGGKNVDFALVSEENFMGVNDKAALSLAETKMQDKIKFELMKKGVIMHLPSTIFVGAEVEFEGECEIESGAVITGKSVIKNSRVRAGSVIEDSVMIDSDAGPCAHLRPGSHIEGTHVGNFVELKNATLKGVKAGHLSYLGDCEIGEGTNIGCGTITCNYDGRKKHRTIIGRNVFVGSDSQFVAPVTVDDDVIIAAGSTVTKDAQKGDLVLARSRQTNKSGYFYKIFGLEDAKK